MLIEQTIEKLTAMRLRFMANSVRERLSRPDHADLSFTEMLGLVVDDEWIGRENRNLAARMNKARFKDKSACMENINYNPVRGLKKSLILELGQNHWIEKNQNLLLTGPTGVGKSFLAQAIGQQACRSGFDVTYLRLPKFLPSLALHHADGSWPQIMRKIAKTRVLILDDWGIPAIADQERSDILEIFEDRYGTGSTIIASQLPVASWHKYLGGGIISDAICDRILHNSQKIELTGESQRSKSKKTNEN